MLSDPSMERALSELKGVVPGIQGLILTDESGIPVFHSLEAEEGIRESSAMSAVAVDVAVRVAQHMNLGSFEHVTFAFSDHYLLLSSLQERRAHLLVLTKKDVNRGLLELTVEKVKRTLERLLADFLYPE